MSTNELPKIIPKLVAHSLDKAQPEAKYLSNSFY